MGLSYCVRVLAEIYFVSSKFTRLTDRRTAGPTDSHFAHG